MTVCASDLPAGPLPSKGPERLTWGFLTLMVLPVTFIGAENAVSFIRLVYINSGKVYRNDITSS